MTRPCTPCDLANRVNNAAGCADEKLMPLLISLRGHVGALQAYLEVTSEMNGGSLPTGAQALLAALEALDNSAFDVTAFRNVINKARMAPASALQQETPDAH